MALAGTTAITELWAKTKAWFGRKVTASRTATTVSVQLKNEANDNLGDAATIAAADGTNAGVMTADMYTKLSGVETGANKTTVDASLSSTSTNPLQNKAINTALAGKAASSHGHDNATTSAAGFMSATDKTKLDGIESGANAYVHPTTTAVAAAAKKVGNDANGHVVLGGALTASDVGAAASSHAHGNITSGGDITATAPTVASGDKLVINDESESKVTNGPAFGTSTSTFLRNDGTWAAPSRYTDQEAVDALVSYAEDEGKLLLSSADYTSAEKTKLSGIAAGAEVNQNTFSNVKVGSTTVAADAKTDTLELVGSNVTLTPDATNDKVTIGITASNVTTALGNTAVNRASANASGTAFGAAATKAVDTSISAGSSSTNLPTSKAVSDFVAAQVTGATAFQGTVDSNDDISGSSYVKGWYWVVATAGTYVGQSCEVGDMVFAIADKGSAYSASDFSVVQNNIVEMTAAEVDAICV